MNKLVLDVLLDLSHQPFTNQMHVSIIHIMENNYYYKYLDEPIAISQTLLAQARFLQIFFKLWKNQVTFSIKFVAQFATQCSLNMKSF